MIGFLLRLLVVAFGLWLASEWVPGIAVHGLWTLFGAALLLGIVNAVVRPLVVLLTLPVTILTLGLFLLVINALLFWAVGSGVVPGFSVAGFWAAMLGAILYSLITWALSGLLPDRK
jgi:putative membrane protein